jgi:hypothetical protein
MKFLMRRKGRKNTAKEEIQTKAVSASAVLIPVRVIAENYPLSEWLD